MIVIKLSEEKEDLLIKLGEIFHALLPIVIKVMDLRVHLLSMSN